MNNKVAIHRLLKGIESGDPESVTVVNEAQYIQHNPQTEEGSVGLAELFKRLSKTNPRVNIVRIFEDRDFVFAHTEYDFSNRNIGFEVFRFEQDQAVEHWDNIQHRLGPNQSGHSMVDGTTEVTDLDNTESNRDLIKAFVSTVLISGELNRITDWIHTENYTEHSPELADGIANVTAHLKQVDDHNDRHVQYQKCHRILAEGNFVLTACEGLYRGKHTSYYDLFRVENSCIVEHWDTRETIAPKIEWKNNNGKF